jgi:hypothetical protein
MEHQALTLEDTLLAVAVDQLLFLKEHLEALVDQEVVELEELVLLLDLLK